MKKILILFLFTTSICFAGNKIPDYKEIHTPFQPTSCINAKTQYEMDACIQKKLDSVTSKMNKIIVSLQENYKTEEPGLFKLLKISQASWENHKKTSCELENYYSRSGTAYGTYLHSCLILKTNERVSYLQWMLDHP